MFYSVEQGKKIEKIEYLEVSQMLLRPVSCHSLTMNFVGSEPPEIMADITGYKLSETVYHTKQDSSINSGLSNYNTRQTRHQLAQHSADRLDPYQHTKSKCLIKRTGNVTRLARQHIGRYPQTKGNAP